MLRTSEQLAILSQGGKALCRISGMDFLSICNGGLATKIRNMVMDNPVSRLRDTGFFLKRGMPCAVMLF